MASFEELEYQTEALHGWGIRKRDFLWDLENGKIFMWYIIILESFKAKEMKNLFA